MHVTSKPPGLIRLILKKELKMDIKRFGMQETGHIQLFC